MEDLVRLWTSICKRAPKVANGPPKPKAKVAIPICSMDEYAKSRLISFCRRSEKEATIIEMIPKPIMI